MFSRCGSNKHFDYPFMFNSHQMEKPVKSTELFPLSPISPTVAKDSLAWTLSPWIRPAPHHRPNNRPPGSTNLPVPPGWSPCLPNKIHLFCILHMLMEGLLCSKFPPLPPSTSWQCQDFESLGHSNPSYVSNHNLTQSMATSSGKRMWF